MAVRIPVLIGTAGLVADEVFLLPNDGHDIIVGRSRSCPISLRRVRQYLEAPPGTRDNDHDFNTVSRKHVRLVIHSGVASVEDLSSNGTWCNDEPVHAPRNIDLNQGPCTLRLGTREQFRLQLMDDSDPMVQGKKAIGADGLAFDD